MFGTAKSCNTFRIKKRKRKKKGLEFVPWFRLRPKILILSIKVLNLWNHFNIRSLIMSIILNNNKVDITKKLLIKFCISLKACSYINLTTI